MRRMNDQGCGRKKCIHEKIKMRRISLILIVLSCIELSAQSQDNPHYMTTDRAIREMQMSLDMPRYTAGIPYYTITDPALREMQMSLDIPRYVGDVPIPNIAGDWQLILAMERISDLISFWISLESSINLRLRYCSDGLFQTT